MFIKNHTAIFTTILGGIFFCILFSPEVSAQGRGYEVEEKVNPEWEGKVVPYTISREFAENAIRIINGAMLEISATTCIRFKPMWSSETKFIQFLPDPTYSSQCHGNPINSEGMLVINFPTSVVATCFTHGNAVKIILNSLGFTTKDLNAYTNASNKERCDGDDNFTTEKQSKQSPSQGSRNSRLIKFCCVNNA